MALMTRNPPNHKLSRTLAVTSKQAESNIRSKLMGQGKVSSFGVVLLECGGIFILRMMIKDAFLAENRGLRRSCHGAAMVTQKASY
jgi:hypothetical protein